MIFTHAQHSFTIQAVDKFMKLIMKKIHTTYRFTFGIGSVVLNGIFNHIINALSDVGSYLMLPITIRWINLFYAGLIQI